MTIGEKIKSLRKQNHMTLEDVAGNISVGRATVLKYENGMITNIPSDKIEQLAKLFNVSPAYLMGWSEDEPSSTSRIDPQIHIVSGMMETMSEEEKQQVIDLVRILMKNHK